MKKKRLIPILLLRNGFLVQSKGFCRYKNLGNPVTAVKRLSEWAADELIYLDISKDDIYDMRRNDLGHPNHGDIANILRDVSAESHMPIVVGGKIRTMDDIYERLKNGADKISLNTKAIDDVSFVYQAAKEFGSQCIIISIDVKTIESEQFVMYSGGKQATKFHPKKFAKIVEENGAGEILLNSIDRDGMKNGYDIELINNIVSSVKIPVIACGGVGQWEDFAEALEKTDVDGIAAANIFHYMDQSVYLAKKFLYEKGLNVRRPDLFLT